MRDETARQKLAAVINESFSGQERFCPEVDSAVAASLVLSRTGPASDIEVTGPDCARRQIDALQKWLARAPRSSFKPVHRDTRFTFKLSIREPQ